MNNFTAYRDISLVPRYFPKLSRSENSTDINFLGETFKGNWVPANMESVISEDICRWLDKNGYFYIYHRFGDTYEFVKNNQDLRFVSISIGVKRCDLDLIEKIHKDKLKVDFVTVDIAHFHSLGGEKTVKYLKKHFPDIKIIGGNVATEEGVSDAFYWGCDVVKIGIANGAACTTYNQTGFGVSMPQCIKNCVEGVPINKNLIIDGGVHDIGDIAKATAIAMKGLANPPMIMCGRLFAACADSPAPISEYSNGKLYYGSASAKQKGNEYNVEGKTVNVPSDGKTYKEKYKEISQAMRSAISYAGGSLHDFKHVRIQST